MADWSDLSIPATVEVRSSEGFGRGLYARSQIRPGADILRDEPYAHVLSKAERGGSCDYCLRSSGNLLRCGQCKFVRYCGQSCQRHDWPLHKVECKGLARIHPNHPSDTIRLVVRILQKRVGRRKQQLPEDAEWEMDLLRSHRESLTEGVREEVAIQLLGVKKLLEGREPFDASLGFDVLCKLLCNTYSIYNEELSAIGTAVYIGPSLLNHSCEPNCVVVYDGPTFRLRATREIQPGEQLLLCYVELLDTRERRRAQLKRVYNFDCRCQRCETETQQESPFRRMYSAKGDHLSQAEIDGAMEKGLLELDNNIGSLRKTEDWPAVASVCQHSLEDQSSVLHPLNVVTAMTLEPLLLSYIELSDWQRALETAEKLSEPYLSYLFRYHPACAVHLMKLGKLRQLIGSTEQLELSIKDLTQAVDRLVVVYGRENPLTKQAIEMLRNSQLELVHRKTAPVKDSVQ